MVSVIIPNYNHSAYLKERIDSVLNQSFQDVEIIILDDCSGDDSRNVIELYRNHPKVSHIIYNDQNSGSTFAQWNKGLNLALGELIWIAESDDVADRELLSRLVPSLAQDKNLVLAYSQSFRMNSSGQVTGDWMNTTSGLPEGNIFEHDFTMDGKMFIQKFLLYKNVIPNASAVVFRKAAYLEAGGADTDVKNCGDWFLWLKLVALGSVCYCSEKLNYFRYHDQSVIGKISASDPYWRRFDIFMREKYDAYLGNHELRLIAEENDRLLKVCFKEHSLEYLRRGKLVPFVKNLFRAL